MAQWQTSDNMGLMDDEDDDADLREALALSMRTYQAEHPGQHHGQQLPSEWHAPAACRRSPGRMVVVDSACTN
jgi:hypothetical protein